jgi:hypothetical protein
MIAALFVSAFEDCAFSLWRLYQQHGWKRVSIWSNQIGAPTFVF